MDLLRIDREFTSRYLNEGFSGGEKKRAEILQLAMLEPEFAVLDETDSGLDIDALRIVSDGVNALREPELGTLIITHYTRILELREARVRAHHARRPDRPRGRARAGRRARGQGLRVGPRGGGTAECRPTLQLEDRRKAALEVYEREPVPTWRRSGFWTTSCASLDLDALEPRHYDAGRRRCPQIVPEDIGDEELAGADRPARRQRRPHATSSDDAHHRHARSSRRSRSTRTWSRVVLRHARSHDEGKFAAATAAFWTGGAFVYVPKSVQVEKPIQVVYLIDEPGTAQYAHTLAVVDEHAEC